MRILLLSDTESKYIWDHFDAERFEDIELVISCGDLQ
jgi:predicted phosphodiesterase